MTSWAVHVAALNASDAAPNSTAPPAARIINIYNATSLAMWTNQPQVDTGNSVASASNNRLYFTINRVSGTGTISYQLWMQVPVNGLNGPLQWMPALYNGSGFTLAFVQCPNLPAALYFIQFTLTNPGDVFQIQFSQTN
jgi:hypothetical protein